MGTRDIALIHLEEELPAALAWARRSSVSLTPVTEALEVRAILAQRDTGELFYLRGRFDEYPEIAPEWLFTDETWGSGAEPRFFPKADRGPTGGSMFHTKPAICAPFNRLAYQQHGGPHGDWQGPASWRTAGNSHDVKAHTLGDMLSAIYQHFLLSRGRMG